MRQRIEVVDDWVVAGDEVAGPGSLFHTFPSLNVCADGAWVLAALVGTTKSGPDGRIRVWRSADAGCTWEPLASPTQADEHDERYGYIACHVVETAPGRLLASYVRADRSRPDEPLFHAETDGMQPTDVRLAESNDGGRTWSAPRDMRRIAPDLFVPGRFAALPDGALGMPGEVWHEWDVGFRDGPHSPIAISTDGGRTWPDVAVMARCETGDCIYGDPRLTVTDDGRVVALFWKHNFVESRDLPVHRSESRDVGRTWSPPHDTGIVGQIANPAALGGNGMLCVYQERMGSEQGMRGVLSDDAGMTWDAGTDTLLWRAPSASDNENPFAAYEGYTFGYSNVAPLIGGDFLATFWASNGRTTCVRALTIRID